MRRPHSRASSAPSRRLGALILRSGTTVHESEQGIHWLHLAARRQDALAAQLLGLLVLPVAGSDAEADAAIDAVRREDPWLACRLRTAKGFRPDQAGGDERRHRRQGSGPGGWSSVPTRPSRRPSWRRLEPSRRFDPRPSRTCGGPSRSSNSRDRADLRSRATGANAPTVCATVSNDPASTNPLFFAKVRSTVLNSLRQGPKWAFHAQQPLRMALAA